ncbi:MAG: hypothetical protein QOH81_300 [Sphingomonadales bacterium]|jgi:thermostable 8-oxoguanine DNA glycosylase|nr:hypothetical protein [Sphingomonadales bacterium]
MQEIWVGYGDGAQLVTVPSAHENVLPGIPWGSASRPFSPAYWAVRCQWPEAELPTFVSRDKSLVEEIGFCLLGGFGIRYEVNKAAFERLRERGTFDLERDCSLQDILVLLTEPLKLNGRKVRYRFPNQRARRLILMRQELSGSDLSEVAPTQLRKRLQELDGIGPKTASWIVRNYAGSDDVAILDVHVIRACRWMALFPPIIVLPRDYEELENRFLKFASIIGVRASVLDAVMWTEVRQFVLH